MNRIIVREGGYTIKCVAIFLIVLIHIAFVFFSPKDSFIDFMSVYAVSFVIDAIIILPLVVALFIQSKFIIDKDKIIKVKRGKEISRIDISQIQTFKYVRLRCGFLLQIGFGCLVGVYYINNHDKMCDIYYKDTQIANLLISMSMKNVKKFKALTGREVLIK